MNVATLMEHRVATARPIDRLDHAATLMRDRDCGSVVIVDEGGRAIGIVTDRDVCLTALRTEQPLFILAVQAAMHGRLFTCRDDDPVAVAEETMALHQVRRLPVVDAAGRLVGMLSLDDIAREACREEGLLAPPVSCAAVGRTLGQITRPHLIGGAELES